MADTNLKHRNRRQGDRRTHRGQLGLGQNGAQLRELRKALPKDGQPRKATVVDFQRKADPNWETARATAQQTIQWRRTRFGKVIMTVDGFTLGPPQQNSLYYWAPINLDSTKRPNELVVSFAHNLKGDVIPFYYQNSELNDVGDADIPVLRVPIEWQQRGSIWVPRTRQKHVDNCDLILRCGDGKFLSLQVSILTRGGKFYISIQEVVSGQIVRFPKGEAPEAPDGTTDDEDHVTTVRVGDYDFTVVPFFDEHAYPGADPLGKMMQDYGPKFVELAAKDEAFADSEEAEIPEWGSLAFPESEGEWIGAAALWFNPLVGGRILCADGRNAYIPIQAIPVPGTEHDDQPRSAMRDGFFPILTPAQAALVKVTEGEKGLLVKSIRPFWPVR